MNKKVALNILKETLTLFEDNGIFSWIVSGTLLGLVRDNALIEYDDDIDIAIHSEEFEKHNVPLLLMRNGYRYHQSIKIINDNHIGSEHTFYKDNIRIDVFGFSHDDEKYWTYAYIPKKQNSWTQQLQPIKYSWDFHKFDKYDALNDGFLFNIPMHPEKWLETLYGPTWKTPIKEWIYEKDCTNMSIDTTLIGRLTFH